MVRVIVKVVENTVEGVRLIISTMVGSGLVVVCLLSNLNLRKVSKNSSPDLPECSIGNEAN
ncbi:MAG: hypothetical protein M3044_11785 [Thermoproteota archaeon]|nr:hypothetical protein [Thermoproteota archaeon]